MTTQQPATDQLPDGRHTPTVADHIVDRLASWGIRRYFGYPGDGINGMTVALQRTSGHTGFVQVRHEETAGFCATAHVKYGGGPIGCALVTSGPGAVHLLNGLYDAKLDHQPVVALVGHAALTAEGGGYYQEVDLLALYKDVAGAFLAQLDDPSQVRHLVDRACRTALAERTVTALVLPTDIQDLPAVLSPPHDHGYYHTSNAPSSRPTIPAAADLEAAADVLRAGERVAMLVGQGALGAEAQVAAIADCLGAGVATALLGMAVVDQREPWATGSIGLLGPRPSWDLMMDCDTLLIVGSNMPYSDFYPPEGKALAVQIDIDGAQMGLRYPDGSQLDRRRRADPFRAARASRRARSLTGVASASRAENRPLARRAAGGGRPARETGEPAAPLHGARRPAAGRRDARCRLRHRHRPVRPPRPRATWDAREPVGHAISRWAARCHTGSPPSSPTPTALIALLGDGAMQTNGVNELITVAKYWREWSDPRFVVLVLNNRDLAS